ncbi:hypothetical protein Ancab_028598 [Ancistrocladus abbreviatus]
MLMSIGSEVYTLWCIVLLSFSCLVSTEFCSLKPQVETALKDAKLTFKEIDEVILVGGSTRMPAIKEIARKLTGKEPNCSVNPDELAPLGLLDAIDTKNQVESVIYQTEKQLKELGDKLSAGVKEKVESKLRELKDAIAGGLTQTIKDVMVALNHEVMQLGDSLDSQPRAAAPGSKTVGTHIKIIN